ncbi:xylene monooxygenase [Methanococcoides methylutens]|uniref:Xylene monooxygenase n=1 Tax=Methanococcoides methylutens TaxID=2226 RepID=A0A099T5J0_METMT|nr:FAD-binding oxidoreductase [Methanococcoides methylutens]KGK99461.1 xylene monooxygenase [Methanococcoides methylutens]
MEFEAPITEIIKQTHDVKSFRLERPEGFDYKAGQYFFVSIPVNGQIQRKPFTISSSPTEKGFLEFTKKLTGHEFSNELDAMDVGDVVSINGPYGRFTFEGEFEKIALISGGIGITPMISICRYCSDTRSDTDIIILSSNKKAEDIAFRDELEEMDNKNANLKVVHTLTRAEDDWPGCRGRICDTIIMDYIPDFMERVLYVCGPPAMMKATEELLLNMNVPKEQIKKEALVGL